MGTQQDIDFVKPVEVTVITKEPNSHQKHVQIKQILNPQDIQQLANLLVQTGQLLHFKCTPAISHNKSDDDDPFAWITEMLSPDQLKFMCNSLEVLGDFLEQSKDNKPAKCEKLPHKDQVLLLE